MTSSSPVTRLAAFCIAFLLCFTAHTRAGTIIAHRGAKTLAPENTLAAQRLAYVNGAEAVECDLRYTSDGAAVIMHDQDVRYTTNGSGFVRLMTLAQVRALDAGSWFSSYYAGEQVPTLQEMLQTAQNFGRKLVIDVKGEGWAQRVRDDVNAVGIQDESVLFLTWSLQMTRDYRRLFPVSQIMHLTGTQPPDMTPADYQQIREAGANCVFFNSSWYITEAEVRRCRENGLGCSLLRTGSYLAFYYLSIGLDYFWASDFDEALSRYSQLESEWQVWLTRYGAPWDSKVSEDPDGDGYANILEYVLGSNPALADTATCAGVLAGHRLVPGVAGAAPIWEWKVRLKPGWKNYCTASLQYLENGTWKTASPGCCIASSDPSLLHYRITAAGSCGIYRIIFEFGKVPL